MKLEFHVRFREKLKGEVPLAYSTIQINGFLTPLISA